MESPLHVQPPKLTEPDVSGRLYGHSFSTNLDLGGQFVCARDDSVVVLDSGSTDDLVSLKVLENHNSYLRKMGFLRAIPYPAMARSKFGDGRVGEVRHAAEIKVGIAGRMGRPHILCFGY